MGGRSCLASGSRLTNRFELPPVARAALFHPMLLTTRPLRNWCLVLFWMAAIFVGSTDLLSSQHTSRWIGPILRWLKPDISHADIEYVQLVVRKGGHVTEYAVLGLLLYRALHRGPTAPSGFAHRTATAALGMAALYAASDEFHQSFVPTRYASFNDVMIDTLGAAAGLGLLWLWSRTQSQPASF
jgi:VanZ family protein